MAWGTYYIKITNPKKRNSPINGVSNEKFLWGPGVFDSPVPCSLLALGHLGNSAALPHLIKALTIGKMSEVRAAVAHAIGNIGRETAIQPLKQILENEEENNKVRKAAFGALYKISRRLGVQILPDDRGQEMDVSESLNQ